MPHIWSFFTLWLGVLAYLAECISPVEIKGAKLFTTDDGNQFFVRGRTCGGQASAEDR